jgi:fructokinase
VGLTNGAGWVHTGSLAAWTEPGAGVIEAHLRTVRRDGAAIVSYDPNIRPLLMPDHAAAVATVERSIGLAHVVKASAEDLGWLYPDSSIEDVLRVWAALGPALVVVTDGANGAHAVTAAGQVWTAPGRKVDVVDTVGAGDAFMAGLINALVRTGLVPDGLDRDGVRTVLDEAILVAALTCARAGANPPTAAELAAAQSA